MSLLKPEEAHSLPSPVPGPQKGSIFYEQTHHRPSFRPDCMSPWEESRGEGCGGRKKEEERIDVMTLRGKESFTDAGYVCAGSLPSDPLLLSSVTPSSQPAPWKRRRALPLAPLLYGLIRGAGRLRGHR